MIVLFLLDVLDFFFLLFARMHLFSRISPSIIRRKQLQKQERGHFEQCSAHQAKKQCSLYDWLECSMVVYIASSESCQSSRSLFSVGTKLKESIFKNNNQISSTNTTRTLVFVNRMRQNVDLNPNVCLNGRYPSGCVGNVLQ